MKIYTKTGDSGQTGLMGGGRVAKDDPRVAAYGDVDETNAAIGLVRSLEPSGFSEPLLGEIQRDLFSIGGALATPKPAGLKDAQKNKIVVAAARIEALEQAIDAADAELPALTSFVLPAGTPRAAALHVARTVCRRAERAVVALSHNDPVAPEILVYLNRLSDLLFTLARLSNHRAGVAEVTW